MSANRIRMALLGAYLVVFVLGSPAPAEIASITKAAVDQATTKASISNANQLANAVSSFSADFQSIAAAVSVGEAIFTNIVPAPGPTAISQLQKELQIITSANVGNIFNSGYEILLNGLAGGDYLDIAEAYLLYNNQNNFNPPPPTPIYPKAGPNDASYSLSENDLRKVIFIPPTFTYGRIPPLILLPGTGALAGSNFVPNYGKLLTQSKIADPVYVNIPNANLEDIQLAAEYAAYSVNYISSLSGGKNVSTSTPPLVCTPASN